MNTLLIFSVLSAAFLHAFWNFQVKDTPNKAIGMAAVMFGHLPLAGIGLLYSGLPSLEATPYLIASAFLHLGYQVFLLNAYRFGSLTSIYPIARGMAPLLITLVSILILNEMLEVSQILGIVIISTAIICPSVLFSFHKEARNTLIYGGTASYLAYVIVLWACLHAPVAIISSLRETSLLFAIILGAVFLKEKITMFKIIMIVSILCGILLLRLG